METHFAEIALLRLFSRSSKKIIHDRNYDNEKDNGSSKTDDANNCNNNNHQFIRNFDQHQIPIFANA